MVFVMRLPIAGEGISGARNDAASIISGIRIACRVGGAVARHAKTHINGRDAERTVQK